MSLQRCLRSIQCQHLSNNGEGTFRGVTMNVSGGPSPALTCPSVLRRDHGVALSPDEDTPHLPAAEPGRRLIADPAAAGGRVSHDSVMVQWRLGEESEAIRRGLGDDLSDLAASVRWELDDDSARHSDDSVMTRIHWAMTRVDS